MSDRIEREVHVAAPAEAVWEAVTTDGWLADEVMVELVPGGDATFRQLDGSERHGWVEDVCTPAEAGDGPARLAFWWALDDEPASRVEVTIEPWGGDRLEHPGSRERPGSDEHADGAERWGSVVRVVETRPLDRLELIGTPLRFGGQTTYGPALVAV